MAEQPQVFAESRVIPMFPTCVWLHDLKPEDSGPINAQILPAIEDMIAQQRTGEAGQTWQTHHDLHLRPEFERFVACARRATKGVLDFLQVDYGAFQITGCWANVNTPGSAHRPHSHPNNYLSGVYYAQVPETSDGLLFHEPRPQTMVMAPKVKKVTELTNSDFKLEVQVGRLLIFPSWLRHSVAKTGAAGDRVSVSFNVMLSNYAEDYSPPRWSRQG